VKLPAVPRILLKLLFRSVLAVVFIGIPVLVFVLSEVGLGQDNTRKLAASLGTDQFSVSIGRLTLHPLRGLVASDVRIIQRGTGRSATVGQVQLGLDISALVAGRVEVEALDLSRTNLEVPLQGGGQLRLEDLHAAIVVTPGQIRVSRFSFDWEGMTFNIHGNLRTVAADAGEAMRAVVPDLPPSQPAADFELPPWVGRVLEVTSEVDFTDRRPLIEAEVSGLISDPDSFTVNNFSIRSGRVNWREVHLKSFSLDASYAGGKILLRRLEVADSIGRLLATGEYSVPDETGSIGLASLLDPLPWLQSFKQDDKLGEAEFSAPPSLQASGEWWMADGRPQAKLIGSVALQDFSFRSVPVRSVRADWVWNEGRFLTRQANIESDGVSGLLDAMGGKDGWRLRFAGQVDPTRIRPWLDDGANKIIADLELEEPADLRIELTWPDGDPSAITGKGHASLGRAAMRGSWIDSAVADFTLGDRAVTYEKVVVKEGKGEGTAALVYDMGQREVRLDKVESSLSPVKMMMWIDVGIANTLKEYRFKSNPNLEVNGRVDMADPKGNDLRIKLKAPGGLNYDLLERTLDVGRTEGNLRVQGFNLEVDIQRAEVFSGSANIKASVSLDPKRPVYSADVKLDRIDFARLTKLYFGYDTSEGKMDANFAYTANMKDQTRLTGRGNLKIKEGNVFAIPILGPFSVILGEILPGVGYQTAREATADFEIANQVITTNNLEIQGQGFSMYGEGDIMFMEDRMDMSIRINAQGVPGIVLFPFSKLFEYVSYGPLTAPVWQPKRVPRQLLNLPGAFTGKPDKKPANSR